MERAQDVIGFHELYNRYSPVVFRFALRLSGDTAAAEDITAETFLRVWAAPVPPRTETVQAWLLTIARNLFLHERRRAWRSSPLGDYDRGVEPVRDETREEWERVAAAVREMAEPDRTILLLRAEEELPWDDIARIVGLTAAAVRVRAHRARLRLAELCGRKEVTK
ncbi:MAG TPA: RNA polymerase sigma factor [Bryobacteraceae bacterium]|nr:RNA polymerase sigma factor [Bryobacteraceae bacterium]